MKVQEGLEPARQLSRAEKVEVVIAYIQGLQAPGK
jgi:hypothetical protein